ncbi:MAG: hypothetical protein JWO81_2869, partial [Alphaproteobacteria bacterium]|nr:hypothetical protein [Alphaproteobacteria bacterium]
SCRRRRRRRRWRPGLGRRTVAVPMPRINRRTAIDRRGVAVIRFLSCRRRRRRRSGFGRRRRWRPGLGRRTVTDPMPRISRRTAIDRRAVAVIRFLSCRRRRRRRSGFGRRRRWRAGIERRAASTPRIDWRPRVGRRAIARSRWRPSVGGRTKSGARRRPRVCRRAVALIRDASRRRRKSGRRPIALLAFSVWAGRQNDGAVLDPRLVGRRRCLAGDQQPVDVHRRRRHRNRRDKGRCAGAGFHGGPLAGVRRARRRRRIHTDVEQSAIDRQAIRTATRKPVEVVLFCGRASLIGSTPRYDNRLVERLRGAVQRWEIFRQGAGVDPSLRTGADRSLGRRTRGRRCGRRPGNQGDGGAGAEQRPAPRASNSTLLNRQMPHCAPFAHGRRATACSSFELAKAEQRIGDARKQNR